MRGIPAFAFLYFVYLGLPSIGIFLSAFQAAVLALGLNAAAYMAEIFFRTLLEDCPRLPTVPSRCRRRDQEAAILSPQDAIDAKGIALLLAL